MCQHQKFQFRYQILFKKKNKQILRQLNVLNRLFGNYWRWIDYDVEKERLIFKNDIIAWFFHLLFFGGEIKETSNTNLYAQQFYCDKYLDENIQWLVKVQWFDTRIRDSITYSQFSIATYPKQMMHMQFWSTLIIAPASVRLVIQKRHKSIWQTVSINSWEKHEQKTEKWNGIKQGNSYSGSKFIELDYQPIYILIYQFWMEVVIW